MVSIYRYTQMMNEVTYNYTTKEWHLSARWFKDLEPDTTLIFSSKYAAHEYVYRYLSV